MKQTSLKLLFFILSYTALPIHSHADNCNPELPSFTINSVEQWNNQHISEIFKQLPKEALSKGKQRDTQAVSLKIWIGDHAKTGQLILSACNGKSLSIEVSDLLINQPEKPKYYLVLTRKNFFKLITANNSKPVIKGIKNFRLNTQ